MKEKKRVDNYILLKNIGKGSFGTVYKAFDEVTNEIVAIKKIDLSTVQKMSLLETELKITSNLNHPSIVKYKTLIDKSKESNELFIVLEYLPGGELFEKILTDGVFSERKAFSFFKDILSAIEYCHANLVVHRDVKLENILLTKDGKRAKLIDFGFAEYIELGSTETKRFCGSPLYSAPEVFLRKQFVGPEVDVWSLGVCLYALITGRFPWRGETHEAKLRDICYGKKIKIPSFVSKHAKDLLSKMLERDSSQRITVQQIKRHPWVLKYLGDGQFSNHFSKTPPISRLDKKVVRKMALLGYEDGHNDLTRRILKNKPSDVNTAYYNLSKYYQSKEDSSIKMMRKRSSTSSRNTINLTQKEESPKSTVKSIDLYRDIIPMNKKNRFKIKFKFNTRFSKIRSKRL